MKILDCEQGSLEWLQARLGILTASNAGLLLVNGKQNGMGAGLISHAYTLIGERFTGQFDDSFRGNAYTERGHELEPIVSDFYIHMGFAHVGDIQQVGIILNFADEFGYPVGASPDRLVGATGGLEIKTRTAKLQAELLDMGEIDKDHLAQVQFNIWVTGRDWWDYISYCEGMPFFIKRFYPDKAMHELFYQKVKAFYQMIDDKTANILQRGF